MLSQAISSDDGLDGIRASHVVRTIQKPHLSAPVLPVRVPCAVWNGSDGRAPVMATAVAVSRPPPPMPADAIGPRYGGCHTQ